MIRAGLHENNALESAMRFFRMCRIHKLCINNFTNMNNGLAAMRAGGTVIGDAGLAVGAVHEDNLAG